MNRVYVLEFRTSSTSEWQLDMVSMHTDRGWVEDAAEEWAKSGHASGWEFRIATFQRVPDPNEVVDSLLTAAEEAKKKEGW